MVEIFNGNTYKGLNTQGLLIDIEEEDGYERADLIMTVLDNIITDVIECMNTEDKDKLYALTGLLSQCKDTVLMAFIPKDENHSPYMPEFVGGFRLESYVNGVSE